MYKLVKVDVSHRMSATGINDDYKEGRLEKLLYICQSLETMYTAADGFVEAEVYKGNYKKLRTISSVFYFETI